MANDSLSEETLSSIIDQVYGTSDTPEPERVDKEPVGEDGPVEDDGSDDGDDVESVDQPDEGLDVDDSVDVDETDDEDDLESDDDSDDDAPRDLLSEEVTVKVNGQEMKITVEDAVKGFQLAAASNARFEEAAAIREEAAEAVQFAEGFQAAWESDPVELLGHLVAQIEDPRVMNQVAEAIILRTAASGALDSSVTEALGIDEDVASRLAIKYEREDLERQRAQLEAEMSADEDFDEPDQYGFTRGDYTLAFQEILLAEELDEVSPDEQRAFLERVLEFGDLKGEPNPYLAYAQFQRAEARKEAERQSRAKRAVKSASKGQATASALAPKGRVQHTPTAPQVHSTEDAAEAALAELERKYGSFE